MHDAGEGEDRGEHGERDLPFDEAEAHEPESADQDGERGGLADGAADVAEEVNKVGTFVEPVEEK